MTGRKAPFWTTIPLNKMTKAQWESLCDGCGRCCLQKLENRKTGRVFYTWVSCQLLDIKTCRCTDYAHRRQLIPSCFQLKPDYIKRIKWLPKTCAYRILANEGDLEWWHPLVSGDPETVHKAGISVQNLAVSEKMVDPNRLEDFIIENQAIY
jgi:uncharacterized protein